MRLAPALLALALAGCAVKGYDLGWRSEGPVAALLGRPLDGLAGCRHGMSVSRTTPACEALVEKLGALVAALPPTPDAPEAFGARCRGGACSYANVYERRDVGVALVVPIYRRIVLREARARLARRSDGRWTLDRLSVEDVAPPGYGPVRIGGAPPAD